MSFFARKFLVFGCVVVVHYFGIIWAVWRSDTGTFEWLVVCVCLVVILPIFVSGNPHWCLWRTCRRQRPEAESQLNRMIATVHSFRDAGRWAIRRMPCPIPCPENAERLMLGLTDDRDTFYDLECHRLLGGKRAGWICFTLRIEMKDQGKTARTVAYPNPYDYAPPPAWLTDRLEVLCLLYGIDQWHSPLPTPSPHPHVPVETHPSAPSAN